jgi:hypothetical protein
MSNTGQCLIFNADEVIPVWRVHEPGCSGGCLFDSEKAAETMKRSEDNDDAPLEITREQMTRREYALLPEFGGF